MLKFRIAFIETKDYFGITGAALSRQCGVSEKHISGFITIKKDGSGYKADLTTETLFLLIQAMDELREGAMWHFFNVLLEGNLATIMADPNDIVKDMNNARLSGLMFAIANKMSSKTSPRYTEEEEMLITH